MIISASYKTDIPAFYGEWFMNRLRAGYCKMVNPYGRQVYRVNLAREDVDGIVFWTKNIGPLMKHLPEVHERGYPFVVQHTINGYPRELESRVADYPRTVGHMHELAARYGPRVAVWRYDPIIISSLTPVEWHRDNFARLARALQGATDEVVISFAQLYKKTKRNMDQAAQERGFTWDAHEPFAYPTDPQDTRAQELVADLADIARQYGITLTVCAQKQYAIAGITGEARCIDAGRLREIGGVPVADRKKTKPDREQCACSASRDIGDYDTCPHGCVYCYAVRNRELALARYREHDPNGEFLFAPEGYAPGEDVAGEDVEPVQQALWVPLRRAGTAGTEES